MNIAINRPQIYTMLLGIIAASVVWSGTNINSILGLLSSKCIVLLGVFFVSDKNILQKLKKAFTNKYLWMYAVVYLWYAVWLLFSADLQNGASTLERKLVFIIFPIIMAGENSLPRRAIEKVVFYFIVSCLLGMLYCEFTGIYYYVQSQPKNFHFLIYELLAAPIMHPGYLSNFFMFSIVWLSLPWVGYEAKYTIPTWLRILLLLLFIAFIFQLTSKTAFIILLFYVPWWIFKMSQSKMTPLQKKYFGVAAFVTLISFVVFVKLVLWFRFSELLTVQPITNNVRFDQSVMSRMASIKEAFEKVKPVWYKGYGTGMANSMLEQQFQQKGYADLVKHHMHNHNQYMRTWLDIGLFGLLYIVAVFVSSSLIFKAKKEWAGFWIIVITLVNCLTDDMLDIQSGVIFFIFFIGLFMWVQDFSKNNLYSSKNL
jgi:O-antigen ligase